MSTDAEGNVSKRSLRADQDFDSKMDCLFCKNRITEREKWPNKANQVMCKNRKFDSSILKVCEQRNDLWAMEVKGRITFVNDLHPEKMLCITKHVVLTFVLEKVFCNCMMMAQSQKYLKLRCKPWINIYIQKLMAHRDKLFQNMNKDPTPSNKYLYKKFRNRVVAEIRSGKVTYFKNCFEQSKTNMKMLWSGSKSIVNVKSKTQLSRISHLTSNGMRSDDPVKMAIIFNQYFVNVGSNLNKTIPRTRKSPIDYLKNRNRSSMFLAPVTTQEIEVIIQSLSTKKSIGSYSIPVFLLKILSKHTSKPFSYLVNLSFQTGILPDYLKVAEVNHIHKKEAFDNPSSYRPISILSVFSKIFEKLMYTRLYKFLDTHKILYPLQFGFHENHSTTQALMFLTETIKHPIDSGKFGCGIFLDLQKAFDIQ